MDKELIKQIEHRDKFFTMFDDFENSVDLDNETLIKKYHLTDVQLQALYHCLSERQILLDCLYFNYFKE